MKRIILAVVLTALVCTACNKTNLAALKSAEEWRQHQLDSIYKASIGKDSVYLHNTRIN